MREIKFRCWSKERKEMIDSHTFMNGHFGESCLSNCFNDKNYIYMQFTGLLDKQGKEIYEGDIVKNTSGRKCQIIWFDKGAMWDTKAINSKGTSFGMSPQVWGSRVEVIGNIYTDKH